MSPRKGAAAQPAAEDENETVAVTEPGLAPGEPSAVSEPAAGEVDEAISKLGDAVARENSRVDLSEEGHQSAIEAMENLGDSLDLDASSLVAGVRDFLLDVIKHRPKPWSATSQAEQRDVAAACEQLADGLVRQIVEVIRADGKEPVRVLLEKVTLGGDAIQISGKVKTLEAEEEDAAVMMLHHARGKHVLLTVASVDDYKGQHRPAETQPDERELPFEAGEHPEDDSDLVEAAETDPDVLVVLPHDGVKAGTLVLTDEHGEVAVHVDLKTGMLRGLTDGDVYVDLREATPAELAAERDRMADFDDSGGGEEAQAEA